MDAALEFGKNFSPRHVAAIHTVVTSANVAPRTSTKHQALESGPLPYLFSTITELRTESWKKEVRLSGRNIPGVSPMDGTTCASLHKDSLKNSSMLKRLPDTPGKKTLKNKTN